MVRVHRLSTRYLTLLLPPAATWLAASAPAVLAIFGPGFDAAATALVDPHLRGRARRLRHDRGRPAGGGDRPGVVSIVSLGRPRSTSACASR